jgi:hypothetical protein
MLGRRLGRGGRPGLIGTAARTAVIAGTATAVSGRVAERQMQRRGDQTAQPPAQPADPAAPIDAEAVSQLERLAALHTQGMLTDDEFAAAKQRVIGV